MNQQQVENLEMRLTCIENQLTHILCVLRSAKPDGLAACATTGKSAEDAAPLGAAITGITTRRTFNPSRGDKYLS
jgi:hypothetical protein